MQFNFQLVHSCVVCLGSSDKMSTHVQTHRLKLFMEINLMLNLINYFTHQNRFQLLSLQ